MSSLYTSAGTTTSVIPLDLVWISEDSEGTLIAASTLSGQEFACYSKACAPPPVGKGGSDTSRSAASGSYKAAYKAAYDTKIAGGGSHEEATKAAKAEGKAAKDTEIGRGGTGSGELTNKGAPQLTEAQKDALFPGRKDEHKFTHDNDTLSIGGLDKNGKLTKFSEETEGKIRDQWETLGPSHDEYVANLVAAGKLAIGVDLATGKIVDQEQADFSLKASKWYDSAHADAKAIADETGINLDNVVAATTVLSAGRKWSGTKSGNAETARALADLAANPRDIEVTQAAIDLMAWKRQKSTKGPGQIGLHNTTPPLKQKLEAGRKVNTNDLDSATLVELLYASNATRGIKTFKEWSDMTTNAAGKIGGKSPKYPKEHSDPLYPLFTSKGTHQVKQAMAFMREEVTAREGITGPKFSSFYSNIRRPDIDYSITNDVWQYRVQAANSVMNSTVPRAKQERMGTAVRGTIKELTLGKDAVNSAQGLLQKGAASKEDGLASGDGMFRDSTGMMRSALNQLAVSYPEQYGSMKGHEYQAVIWLHYGGGKVKGVSDAAWNGALDKMKEAGL